MSNQRPFSEENMDQAQFNYQKYLPQNYNPSSYLPTYKEEDSQMTAHFQNRLNSLPADSYRSNQQSTLDSNQGKATPHFYGSYQHLQSQQQVRNPLDNLQNTYNKFQEGNGGFSQSDTAYSSVQFKSIDNFSKALNEQIQTGTQPPNFPNQHQQQMLMLELLKSNPQLMSSGSQPGPMFGAGFLGAAQLLANQQAANNSQVNTQSQSDFQSNTHKPNNHGIPDQNMMFLQELNKLYSHVNHYQNQIDQIERKSSSTPAIQNQSNLPFQSNPPNARNFMGQPTQQYSQPHAPQPYEQYKSSQFFGKNDGDLNQSLMNNQSVNHFDLADNSKINSNAGNNNVFNYEQKLRQASQYGNILNIDKQYNEGNSLRHSKNLSRYEDQQIIQELNKQSPMKDQKSPGANSSFRYNQETHLGAMNDSLVKFSNQNSPIKNSFQNPNQILQEQQLNSMNYNNQGVNKSISLNNKSGFSGNGEDENNQSYQQKWAQNNSKVVNVDDIPIVSKTKTFEELLESNLKESGQEYTPMQPVQPKRNEKKQFLKKNSKKVNVPAGPTKRYNYYIENFEEVKKPVPTQGSQDPHETSHIKHDSKNNHEIPTRTGPSQNKSSHNPSHYNSQPTNQADSQPPKPKKPFLSRGTGRAGGKGLDKSAQRKGSAQKSSNSQQDNFQRSNTDNNLPQKQSSMSGNQKQRYQPTHHSDFDQEEILNNEQDIISPNRYENQQPVSRAQNAKKTNPRHDITRSSIVEFEKLEQECIKKFSPNTQSFKQTAKEQNKKKKKLFDSDSEEEGAENDQFEKISDRSQEEESSERNHPAQEKEFQEEVPKSDVVKKFFYKQDPKAAQVKKQTQKGANQNPNQNLLSEEMEKMIKEKVDQLNQAVESVNAEKEKLEKQKRENENLRRKLKEEQRELDGRKKRENDDFERYKNDEIEKLRKEKKQLEQRQKNLQLVNNSSKREREEIEYLKKELQKVQEEAKVKEQKSKSTIERLKKQVNDLTAKNKELQDEIKHLDQIRINNTQSQQKSQKGDSNSKSGQPRYTFSANDGQKNQNKNQPIKGILKNKNEYSSSPNKMYYNEEVEEQEAQQDEDEGQGYVDEADDPTYEQQQHQRENQERTNQAQNESEEEIKEPSSNDNAEGEEEEDYDIKYPLEYHNKEPSNMKVVEQVIGNDGKIQRVYENGKKEVLFNNGVKREVFPDGYTIVYFNNNDIKQTYPDQKVVYYFAEAKTTQTTFPDGLQVFKFANHQIEKHFPDGTKEIIFPDGTIKCIFADGEEESIFPDGTIQRIEKNGIKAIEFANGQKDILFPDGTRIREYPDGRIRKQYPDGTYETSYRQ